MTTEIPPEVQKQIDAGFAKAIEESERNPTPEPLGVSRPERADWRARASSGNGISMFGILLDDGPKRMLDELDAIDALLPPDFNPHWTTVSRVKAFITGDPQP